MNASNVLGGDRMLDMDYGDFLERAARVYRNRTAIIDEGGQITYADLCAKARALAAALGGIGLKPGDQIAELRHNSIDSVVYEFAVAMMGGVRVALNPRLTPNEVQSILAKLQVRAVCTTPENAALIPPGAVEYVISEGVDGALSVDDRLWAESARPWHAEPEDIFSLRLTGGTTGLPKAATMSHRALVTMGTCVLMEYADLTDEDRILNTQPYSHGGFVMTLPAVMRGSCLIMQRSVNVDDILDAIEKKSVTVVKFVPTLLSRLVRAQASRPRDISSLRLMCYGAAPMPENVLREAMNVFACDFSQTYGQTEAPGVIACLGPRDHRRAKAGRGRLLESVGRPYPLADVAILDAAGNELPDGQVGEVTVRGPFVTQGYWNEPVQSSELKRHERIHTKDLGYLEDGYLYLVGRADDTIISGGFNVYPSEVEHALRDLPAVADAAVFGVPDDEWGSRVVAAVVLGSGCVVSAEAIKEHCRRSLAGYKCPKDMEFMESLPLTSNGKVDRNQLRRDVLARQSAGQASV